MIDSMETVPANSLLEPRIGTGIGLRNHGHVMMKACVEDSELRHVRHEVGDNLHPLEF
jgi:hypothetical protein